MSRHICLDIYVYMWVLQTFQVLCAKYFVPNTWYKLLVHMHVEHWLDFLGLAWFTWLGLVSAAFLSVNKRYASEYMAPSC